MEGLSDYVMEHYCDTATDSCAYEVIQCPANEKCVASLGKCVAESTFSCTENDCSGDPWDMDCNQGGFFGTCTDITGSQGDECDGRVHESGEFNGVVEYKCENNMCVRQESWCGGGDQCQNGLCIDIPGSEVTTNPQSSCYGRTNYMGVTYGCWGRGFDQATCENSYQDGGNGIWYGCEWDGLGCGEISICARY